MNILYTLNDNFVPQVGTGITSICKNNKKAEKINFYIISYGIKKDNKNKLSRLCKKYNRDIDIIELDDLNEYFDFNFDTLGWNKVILARLLMGSILPKTVDKIIYLDGDTVVRDGLKELWETNLGSSIVGMSIEPTVDKKRKKSLDIENYPYYNSGVILVNLKKWRDKNCEKKIIQYYKEKNGLLFAADQDAINVVLKDNIHTISPKYNYYNIFYQYSYYFLSKLMKPLKYADYVSKEMYDEARQNPTIIHYLGEERPWRKGNTHKYKNDYQKYLKMTPWKNAEEEEGWKLYFVCWNIFNFVTKPFPLIRYNIINSLIPTFMKIRKNKIQKGNKK